MEVKFSIALLPGDGIGPEVLIEGQRVLDQIAEIFGHQINYREGMIGGCAIDATGEPLPDETVAMCKRADAVLLGAVGGPKWDDPKSETRPEAGLLKLRSELRLFANLRPVSAHPDLIDATPFKPHLLRGLDLLMIRELTGGLYFGKPKRRWSTAKGRRAIDTMVYSEREIERVLRIGFELAQGRRKKLTSVDKANVLETSRLWREIATELSADYPNVELQHMLVDTASMNLVRAPTEFDVIVTENTFGDILTDEAAVLAGSMGMLPSASLGGQSIGSGGASGRNFGLYEPIHGSAPDIAGQNKANPLAMILSVALMLRFSLGEDKAAAAVEVAVQRVLGQGTRTLDIAGQGERAVTTQAMASAVVEALQSSV